MIEPHGTPSPPPRVSVCVPTYNGALFLGETLACIEAQTMQDYEVLIVDDLSTDDTLGIAGAYAGRDKRVRVIRNTERAGSSARNANCSIGHARGEWIKFLFQDDRMAPNGLERMLEAGTHGRLVFSWHDYIFTGEVDPATRAYYESLPTLRSAFPLTGASPDEFSAAMVQHWYTNFIGPTSSSFIHRTCFDDYGEFAADIRSFPDLEYWIRVGNVEGLSIVPEYLVSFRVHETSVSGAMRRSARTFRQDLEQLQLVLNLARSPGYANIRAAAQATSLDPEARLRESAQDARWMAEDARYRTGNTELLAQWDTFCARNPSMPEVVASIDASMPPTVRMRRWLKRMLAKRR